MILSVKVSLDDGQVRIGRCHLGEESHLGVGGLHRYDFIVDDDRPDGVMPTPKPLLSINPSRINHLARIRPPSELQWWLLGKLELIITQRHPR